MNRMLPARLQLRLCKEKAASKGSSIFYDVTAFLTYLRLRRGSVVDHRNRKCRRRFLDRILRYTPTRLSSQKRTE